MSKGDTYRQVEMRNVDGRVDVCWLPAALAVVGKRLIIGDKITGDRGWSVTIAYNARKREALDVERTTQRKYEDDLEPHR